MSSEFRLRWTGTDVGLEEGGLYLWNVFLSGLSLPRWLW